MKKPERVDGFGMNKLVATDHRELCIAENVECWFKIMIICEYGCRVDIVMWSLAHAIAFILLPSDVHRRELELVERIC